MAYTSYKYLTCVVLTTCMSFVSASHFRGAVITWKPGTSEREIIVDYRISWRRSYASDLFCDANTIQSGASIGASQGTLNCLSNCNPYNTAYGSMSYQCTDFSVQEDWSSGWGRQTITLPTNSSLNYELGFTGNAWISLNIGGSSDWVLRLYIDLNNRNDSGNINSSPTLDVAPIYRLQYGCTNSIVIPVHDPDGDVVRCRWTSSSPRDECGSICGAFPAHLDSDTCTITYNATGSLGWYGVAVQAEDFMTANATSPLSSVPVQFLVNVYQSSESCDKHAEFIGPTPPDNACFNVPRGDIFHTEIVVRVANANKSISEIKTTSPLGMVKSSLTKISATDWKINVTWSPQHYNDVNNIFCFTAVESGSRFESKRRCITLFAGDNPPHFVQAFQSPKGLTSPHTRQWSITVDKNFVRASNHSYIRVYNSHGVLEETIDASDPGLVRLNPSSRLLMFDTTFNLIENEEYYVLFDSGVVTSTTHCGAGSAPINNTHFWRVTIQTPVRLVSGPSELAGRLEVYYNGAWRTVCGQNLYNTEADVFCRMLRNSSDSNVPSGRVLYNAYYGTGNGLVMATDLNCNGSEVDISLCPSPSRLYTNGTCSHSQDVSLDCRTFIRLMGGSSSYSGRVEVNNNGTWGTVCDDRFDRDDGIAICKMLGYYRNYYDVQVYGNAFYGQGNGPIMIDELQCNGDEVDISICHSNPWYHHDCSHSEDASVDCHGYTSTVTPTTTMTRPSTLTASTTGFTSIRLVNGTSSYSGRVELYYNGRWGTVCDDDFDHNDVKVICRMLGIFRGDNYGKPYQSAHFGEGSGDIMLDDLSCNGYESDQSQCGSGGWFNHNCGHNEDAGVNCYAYNNDVTTYTTNHWSITTTGYSIESVISVRCNDYGWDITVDMYRLRQIYPGAIASDIYLGENSCTGNYNGYSVTFQQGLRECLTSERIRNDILLYTNELVYAQHDPNHPFIIRHYNWTVGVECDVQRNETSSGHLHHDSISNTGHYVTGASDYSVNMTFFHDPNFLYPIAGNPLHVQVGTQVYVKVFTTASDWTIKLKVHTCYTKPTPSSPEHLNFDIIKNGCEVDSNTHIISQSSHETRFVFEDFEYTSNHEGIYLYCDATFCGSSDYSRHCLQTCNPVVRRRSAISTRVADATTDKTSDETMTTEETVTEDQKP